MDADFRDGKYLLSVNPLELRTISTILLLFPGGVSAQDFEALVGMTKEDAEKIRFQLDLCTRCALRAALLRELEDRGRVSELLAEIIPDPIDASLQELRKAFRRSADAHVVAIESGTDEQEVLTEAVLRRVIQAISDVPEGPAMLRESAEAGSAAEQFAVAGHWGELDRPTALRLLRDIDLDYTRPLLSHAARMTAALLFPSDT